MKLRIARKIQWWGWPIFSHEQTRQAEKRIRKYEKNSSHTHIFKDSIALARLIETHGAHSPIAADTWQHLRANIVKYWCPGGWSEYDTHAHGITVFNEKYSDNTTETIVSNLEYYSDRWCNWRIAVIDCAFAHAVE